MSATQARNNLAARMGRWSAAHWKTATFGWLAFVVVAFALGGAVGTKNARPEHRGPRRVRPRWTAILDAGFKQPAGESVLIQSRLAHGDRPGLRGRGRRRRAASREARRRSRTSARRATARSRRTAARRSSSSRSPARPTRPPRRSTRCSTAVDDAQKAHPELYIGEFGDASAVKAVETAFGDDLAKAGLLSLPITLDHPRRSRSARSSRRAFRCCSR